MNIAYDHIFILFFQCLIIAALLLSLFRLRSVFGLSLLYTALGVLQFMQVFMYNSIYFEITSSILVSPGTMIFAGSLIAILLVYIREDALEARKVIYAILAANLVLAFMQFVISWGIDNDNVLNIYGIPIEFFTQEIRVIIVGTLALFLDAFIVIFIYEIISKHVSSLFLRIFFSTAIVLSTDALIFNLGTIYGTDRFLSSLNSHLISKNSAAFVYSILFTIYLTYFDKKPIKSESKAAVFNDIFSMLTYRQKYEQVFSEKVQLDKKLQEQEIQYQTMFEKARNVIYVISLEGKLTSINPAFETLTGWTVNEWIHQPFTKLVHLDDLHLAMNSFKSILEEKEVAPYELRILCKSGEYIIGEFTPALLKSNNKSVGVLGIAMDITERKKTELKLIDSENYIRLLFDSSIIGLALASMDGKLIDLNPAFAEIIGRTVDEVKQLSYWDITPEKYNEQEAAQLIKLEELGRYGPYEKEYIHKDGHLVPVVLNGIIIERNGTKYIWSSVEDITDRKLIEADLQENQELLRLSSEVANVAAWEFDFTTGLMSRSKNHDALYGLKNQEKWEFATFTNATHPDDRDMSASVIHQSVAIGGPDNYKFDFRVIYPDQTIHWLNVIGKVVKRDSNGVGILVRGFLIDITDRKNAEIEKNIIDNRFANTLEFMSEGFVSLDKNWNYTYVNDKAGEMFGRKPSQLIGKHIWTEFPEGIGQPFYKNYYKAIETNLPVNFEDYYPPWDKWFENRVVPSDEGISIFFHDITERKKNELELEQYRNNLETLIKERTQELEKKNKKLDKMNKVFVGRELRMKELKKEIDKLKVNSK